MKVQIELLTGKTFIVDVDPAVHLSDHFTLGEMANNEGDKNIPQYIINSRVSLFLKMHEAFRVWFNRPYRPNGSYRQLAFNKKVGGVSNSRHLKGLAVDIPFPNMTDAQWKNIYTKWMQLCNQNNTVGEAGRYSWGFHLGMDIEYQKTFNIFDNR